MSPTPAYGPLSTLCHLRIGRKGWGWVWSGLPGSNAPERWCVLVLQAYQNGRLLVRHINRLAIGALKALRSPHDGDLTTALIYSRIVVMGRSGRLPADPRFDAPSISVHEAANSLRLPYETVRTRVAALLARGVCERDGKGVLVPDAVFYSPERIEARQALTRSVSQSAAEMAALGLLPNCYLGVEGAASFPADNAGEIALPFKRFLCASFVEYNSVFESADRALVFMALIDANTVHLLGDTAAAWRFAEEDTPPPDSERRPVSIRSLAEALGAPPETVRRHMGRLEAQGYAERCPAGGYIAPTRLFTGSTEVRQAASRIPSRFLDMMQTLRLAGFPAAAAAPVTEGFDRRLSAA